MYYLTRNGISLVHSLTLGEACRLWIALARINPDVKYWVYFGEVE